MKKHIFYHVFPRFNWCDLVQDQLSKIFESGLYDSIESLNIILLSTIQRIRNYSKKPTQMTEWGFS